ncbi:hypothetical protein [Flagellimonas zhangzhouensis]|uniref:Lipoprotein n=1 Tax=Flagellimonas zhangzhouensis TaxID=1073328 RepID=A0A1H2WXH8_9FLAO|nr:hypothetical protein [Allomuricauda zhangzhouensis]SDQ25793.1 hypothetical protein SAMN05216294_1105 [Allomuricauda zhangzhouensis]SDW85271.1 hypothetical protein SAMN04487892_2485 [Allomuricauda zhangzhouensis]
MKNLILPKTKFNTKNLIVLGAAAFTLTFASCSNGDDGVGEPEATITEEEAAEAIAMSVSPDSGGMVEITQEAIYTLEEDNSTSGKAEDYECGVEYGSSYNISGQSGSISYDASLIWSWMVQCGTGIIPSAADFELDGTSTYDGPRISSEASTSATINITNLDDASNSYLVNETFSISGTQESNVSTINSFTSTIEFTTTNLAILKSNYNIASGTVYASFVGKATNGNSYNFSGTLEFTGNQTATLTMGSGNTYNLAW